MAFSKHEAQPQDKSSMDVLGQANNMIRGFFDSALNSSDKYERIKGTLASQGMARLAVKKQYEQAKAMSVGTAQFALDRILGILIEQENYLDMLEREDKKDFPSSMEPYLMNLYGDRCRIKKFKDFFESEYFRLDPLLQVMPPYLREKIRLFQTKEISFSECKNDLLYSIALFSNSDHRLSFTNIQLKEIANAHNHSYLDLLIGREALSRAKDCVSYVEVATDLLMPRNISYHQRTEILENEQDATLNKETLVRDIKSFVTENDEFSVKCQLIKAKIENKLIAAYSLTPWTLGWMGSRYTLEHAGKIFNVPQGIYDLYQLVQSPKENASKIQELVTEKQKPIHPICSFFRFVTGTSRSEETQQSYAELNSIISRTY